VISESVFAEKGIFLLAVTKKGLEFIATEIRKASAEASKGDGVNARVPRGSQKPVRQERTEEGKMPKTWIFQSRRRWFQLGSAVRQLPEHVWNVSRYGKEIHVGDRVYLWEAGVGGGILAVAEVMELPRVQVEPEAQLSFVHEGRPFAGERLRVKLRVTQLLEPTIERKYLQSRPEFAGLSILRNARGTNFRVSPEDASRLAIISDICRTDPARVNSAREKPIRFAESRYAARDGELGRMEEPSFVSMDVSGLSGR
jgi:hypothetical protein